jgi:hypothetical protein
MRFRKFLLCKITIDAHFACHKASIFRFSGVENERSGREVSRQSPL